MKIIFFEWADYEKEVFNKLKSQLPLANLELEFVTDQFNVYETHGAECISIFVDSRISDDELQELKRRGVTKILLRCAGYNMLNVSLANSLGITVVRVASYSPESIGEHVFALILSVARKMNVNFRKHVSRTGGRDISQMGTLLEGKKIGFYGLGKIGSHAAKIAKHGFGMEIFYFDPNPLHIEHGYTEVKELKALFDCDIVSIHVPLNEQTIHTVDAAVLAHAHNVILINTARGKIVNLNDCIEALENGNLSGLGFDVAEDDDACQCLPVDDRIVFTHHTGFFTVEAVESILIQTFQNINLSIPENIVQV